MMGGDQIDEPAVVHQFDALNHVIFCHAACGKIGRENVNATAFRHLVELPCKRTALARAHDAILRHEQCIAGFEVIEGADEGGSLEGRFVDRVQRRLVHWWLLVKNSARRLVVP